MFRPPEREDIDFENEEDRVEWEAEQKRLDREWYGLDEGQDDEQNAFSNMSSGESQTAFKHSAIKIFDKSCSLICRQVNSLTYSVIKIIVYI